MVPEFFPVLIGATCPATQGPSSRNLIGGDRKFSWIWIESAWNY